jgi:hypothetical protein
VNIGLISFAGGDPMWKLARNRMRKQAIEAGIFTRIRIFSPSDLQKIAEIHDFDFISSNSRGFGYWIWKPILILDFLRKNPEIEAILYADTGCDLNFNENSKKTWERYLNLLGEHSGIAFKMELLENDWTKQEVFDYFPEFNAFRNTEQLLAGVFIMEREFAINFCEKWLKAMRTSNYFLLNDNFDKSIQHPTFIQHRHDQSIFSLLIKQNPGVLILDSFEEVYFEPDWTKGYNFPIWTSRNKSFVPLYETGYRSKIIRIGEKFLKKLLR